MTKKIDLPNYYDFTIKDNGKVYGHVRVTPNGVAWKPSGAEFWQQVTLEQFASFCDEKGKRRKYA